MTSLTSSSALRRYTKQLEPEGRRGQLLVMGMDGETTQMHITQRLCHLAGILELGSSTGGGGGNIF
jgi:hypothetical protein